MDIGALRALLESNTRKKNKMEASVLAKKLEERLHHGCEVLPAAFNGVKLRFVHTARWTHPACEPLTLPLVRASCWA